MTCPHCTPADPNDCVPCAIRGQDKEAVRGDLARARTKIVRLRIALGYIRRLAQSDIDSAAEGIQTAVIEVIARRALKEDGT